MNNPPDCTCSYTHCSDTTCPSKEPSKGPVKESARLFPSPQRVELDEEATEALSIVTRALTGLAFTYEREQAILLLKGTIGIAENLLETLERET